MNCTTNGDTFIKSKLSFCEISRLANSVVLASTTTTNREESQTASYERNKDENHPQRCDRAHQRMVAKTTTTTHRTLSDNLTIFVFRVLKITN